MAGDPTFIRRVYRTTLWVSAIGVIGLGARGYNWPIYVGYAAGVAVGLGSLAVLEAVVNRALLSERSKTAASAVAALSVLKVPVLAAIVYVLYAYAGLNLIAVCVGIGMPVVVIVLKVAGRAVRLGGAGRTDKGAEHSKKANANSMENEL